MKPRRRYVVRTRAHAPAAEAPNQREMLAVREVVHAFLNADHPQEAVQFALDRVAPLVGASLASVYLVDGASELMRLVAASNWPEHLRPWLADVRVRVGFGPSGEAASERRAIEVPDVFAHPDLEDWQEVARELGFRALVAVPLLSGSTVLGAVAFYFSGWSDFTPERRMLLRLTADLIAGGAEKSRLVDRVRRAEAATIEALSELDRQYVTVALARSRWREFADRVVTAMETGLGSLQPASSTADARAAVDDIMLIVELEAGSAPLADALVDPREPLSEAIARAVPGSGGADVVLDNPSAELPPIRTDRAKVTLLLARLLQRSARGGLPEVRVTLAASDSHVQYRMPGRAGSDLSWQLAEALVSVLCGTIEVGAVGGIETVTVSLPFAPEGGATATNRRA